VYQQGKSKVFSPFSWLLAGDVLAIAISFLIPSLISHPETVPTYPEFALYAFLILANCRIMNLYTWGAFTLAHRLFVRLAATLLLSAFYFALLRFVFTANDQAQAIIPLLQDVGQETTHWLNLPTDADYGVHRWIFIQMGSAFVLLIFIRRLILLIAKKSVGRMTIERVAFVGWSSNVNLVLKAMARQKGVFLEVAGFLYTTRDAAMTSAVHGYRSLGEIAHLEEKLLANNATLLIVDQTDISPTEMRRIAEVAARNLVSLEIIQSSFDVWASYLGISVMGGVPVVGIVNRMRHEEPLNRMLKRLMDIIGALIGLTIAAPIIAIFSIFIYLESPGPVFYRQKRLTAGGREFQMIKLRSMKLDADNVPGGGVGWTVKNDPRRLRVGIFLRQWNLDELPQFWNVLKGDMSMVGPRPERMASVENFKHTIRYYNLRLACKAGLTGWAAVHGLRGDTSIEDRLTYDLYYIENWSLWLDVKIVFMTLLPPENAY
jgi:exopolysaccharide biosynthesis polyprenyl glycosylphosphotransferase